MALPKLIKMNLIDMRIFSTQLMMYLKTSCHSLTTHISGLYLGSDNLCRGICVNFIKTISEVLRNNVIDHMKQGNAFKKSPPGHS
jgi:hypothetical protein